MYESLAFLLVLVATVVLGLLVSRHRTAKALAQHRPAPAPAAGDFDSAVASLNTGDVGDGSIAAKTWRTKVSRVFYRLKTADQAARAAPRMVDLFDAFLPGAAQDSDHLNTLKLIVIVMGRYPDAHPRFSDIRAFLEARLEASIEDGKPWTPGADVAWILLDNYLYGAEDADARARLAERRMAAGLSDREFTYHDHAFLAGLYEKAGRDADARLQHSRTAEAMVPGGHIENALDHLGQFRFSYPRRLYQAGRMEEARRVLDRLTPLIGSLNYVDHDVDERDYGYIRQEADKLRADLDRAR